MATIPWFNFDAHNALNQSALRAFSINHPQHGRLIIFKGVSVDDAAMFLSNGYARTQDNAYAITTKAFKPQVILSHYPSVTGKMTDFNEIDLTAQLQRAPRTPTEKPLDNSPSNINTYPPVFAWLNNRLDNVSPGVKHTQAVMPSTLGPVLETYLDQNAQKIDLLNGVAQYRLEIDNTYLQLDLAKNPVNGIVRVTYVAALEQTDLPSFGVSPPQPVILTHSDDIVSELSNGVFSFKAGEEQDARWLINESATKLLARQAIEKAQLGNATILKAPSPFKQVAGLFQSQTHSVFTLENVLIILEQDKHTVFINEVNDPAVTAQSPAFTPIDPTTAAKSLTLKTELLKRGFDALAYIDQAIDGVVVEALIIEPLDSDLIIEATPNSVVTNTALLPAGYGVTYGQGAALGQLSIEERATHTIITKNESPWFDSLEHAIDAIKLEENQSKLNPAPEIVDTQAISAVFNTVDIQELQAQPASKMSPLQMRPGPIDTILFEGSEAKATLDGLLLNFEPVFIENSQAFKIPKRYTSTFLKTIDLANVDVIDSVRAQIDLDIGFEYTRGKTTYRVTKLERATGNDFRVQSVALSDNHETGISQNISAASFEKEYRIIINNRNQIEERLSTQSPITDSLDFENISNNISQAVPDGSDIPLQVVQNTPSTQTIESKPSVDEPTKSEILSEFVEIWGDYALELETLEDGTTLFEYLNGARVRRTPENRYELEPVDADATIVYTAQKNRPEAFKRRRERTDTPIEQANTSNIVTLFSQQIESTTNPQTSGSSTDLPEISKALLDAIEKAQSAYIQNTLSEMWAEPSEFTQARNQRQYFERLDDIKRVVEEEGLNYPGQAFLETIFDTSLGDIKTLVQRAYIDDDRPSKFNFANTQERIILKDSDIVDQSRRIYIEKSAYEIKRLREKHQTLNEHCVAAFVTACAYGSDEDVATARSFVASSNKQEAFDWLNEFLDKGYHDVPEIIGEIEYQKIKADNYQGASPIPQQNANKAISDLYQELVSHCYDFSTFEITDDVKSYVTQSGSATEGFEKLASHFNFSYEAARLLHDKIESDIGRERRQAFETSPEFLLAKDVVRIVSDQIGNVSEVEFEPNRDTTRTAGAFAIGAGKVSFGFVEKYRPYTNPGQAQAEEKYRITVTYHSDIRASTSQSAFIESDAFPDPMEVAQDVISFSAKFYSIHSAIQRTPLYGEKLDELGDNKYNLTEINKRIRSDIKEAMQSGVLPKGLKTSIRKVNGSIYINVQSVPSGIDIYSDEKVRWHSENDAKDYVDRKDRPDQLYTIDGFGIYATLKNIASAYNYNKSDYMTDYSNFNYLLDISFDDAILQSEIENVDDRVIESAPPHSLIELSPEAFRFAYDLYENGFAYTPDGVRFARIFAPQSPLLNVIDSNGLSHSTFNSQWDLVKTAFNISPVEHENGQVTDSESTVIEANIDESEVSLEKRVHAYFKDVVARNDLSSDDDASYELDLIPAMPSGTKGSIVVDGGVVTIDCERESMSLDLSVDPVERIKETERFEIVFDQLDDDGAPSHIASIKHTTKQVTQVKSQEPVPESLVNVFAHNRDVNGLQTHYDASISIVNRTSIQAEIFEGDSQRGVAIDRIYSIDEDDDRVVLTIDKTDNKEDDYRALLNEFDSRTLNNTEEFTSTHIIAAIKLAETLEHYSGARSTWLDTPTRDILAQAQNDNDLLLLEPSLFAQGFTADQKFAINIRTVELNNQRSITLATDLKGDVTVECKQADVSLFALTADNPIQALAQAARRIEQRFGLMDAATLLSHTPTLVGATSGNIFNGRLLTHNIEDMVSPYSERYVSLSTNDQLRTANALYLSLMLDKPYPDYHLDVFNDFQELNVISLRVEAIEQTEQKSIPSISPDATKDEALSFLPGSLTVIESVSNVDGVDIYTLFPPSDMKPSNWAILSAKALDHGAILKEDSLVDAVNFSSVDSLESFAHFLGVDINYAETYGLNLFEVDELKDRTHLSPSQLIEFDQAGLLRGRRPNDWVVNTDKGALEMSFHPYALSGIPDVRYTYKNRNSKSITRGTLPLESDFTVSDVLESVNDAISELDDDRVVLPSTKNIITAEQACARLSAQGITAAYTSSSGKWSLYGDATRDHRILLARLGGYFDSEHSKWTFSGPIVKRFASVLPQVTPSESDPVITMSDDERGFFALDKQGKIVAMHENLFAARSRQMLSTLLNNSEESTLESSPTGVIENESTSLPKSLETGTSDRRGDDRDPSFEQPQLAGGSGNRVAEEMESNSDDISDGQAASPIRQSTGDKLDGVRGTGGSGSETKGDSRTNHEQRDRFPVREPRHAIRFDARTLKNLPTTGADRATATLGALTTLSEITKTGREPTPEDCQSLAKMVGFGASNFHGSGDIFSYQQNKYSSNGRIRALLQQDHVSYLSAQDASLTSFFTPPHVTQFMWEALEKMGLDGSHRRINVLDGAVGTGAFIGHAPTWLREQMTFTGVELDTTTAKIASLLYPEANIINDAFEKVGIVKASQDLVIGNPPYANVRTYNPRTKKREFIHDMFMSEGVHSLRENGILCFITSSGTLDKKDSSFREQLASKADLLHAIRMPKQTFQAHSGTEVMTDIIFLRVKAENEPVLDTRWTRTSMVDIEDSDETMLVNQYFIDNPDHIVGELTIVSSQFGPKLSCTFEGDNFENALKDQLKMVPESCFLPGDTRAPVEQIQTEAIKNSEIVEQYGMGGFFIDNDDQLRVVTLNSETYEIEGQVSALPLKKQTAAKQYVHIKECVLGILNAEKVSDSNPQSDAFLQSRREHLRNLHGNFYENFGALNAKENYDILYNDPNFITITGIEIYDQDTGVATLSDIANERVVAVKENPPSTPYEALLYAFGKYGEVKKETIEELTGSRWDELYKDIEDHVIFDPQLGEYTLTEVYLSGDVKSKREFAQRAVKTAPELAENIARLEKVIPSNIPLEKIHVALGASWIPEEPISEFLRNIQSISKAALKNIAFFKVFA